MAMLNINLDLNPKLLQEEGAKLKAINMAIQFKAATNKLENLQATIK